jgi:hypothetical protein
MVKKFNSTGKNFSDRQQLLPANKRTARKPTNTQRTKRLWRRLIVIQAANKDNTGILQSAYEHAVVTK